MSFFSRLFRKALLSPPVTESAASTKRPEAPVPVRPEPSAADRAAAAAREEQALEAAVASRDAQAIARWALEGSSTKIRQQAAQAIEDPVQLRQLIKEVRGGSDKNVYRILTRKRDALLAQERQQEQLQAEINAAASSIERHSHRPYDSLFTPTLEQLQGRWKALSADASADVVQSVQQAIDRAREVIAQHLRQIAMEASRQLAAENAAAEAQRLREIDEKAAAADAAERALQVETERKARAEQEEAQSQAFRQVGGLIRKARTALTEGSTGRAAGLRRAIEEKLPAVGALPGYLASQLQQLDAKLNELKDWKSFSVTPKRAELMEEMESLVDSTLDPPALADRIKGLQEEWRTLSKGAGESLEADWQRFHEAAQKAYQPCREYFEAQSLRRQENLKLREALLQRLETFDASQNWEQPDWRLVGVALRESKLQWRQHSPVDRAAGKALQARFDALSASLQGRLDAEHARNIKEKKLLIERAQKLLDSEDSRKAIDEVKSLQQKWQTVGPIPRDVSQQLWEDFRQHCDAVFQKRSQAFAEYTAGLEANKSKAIALCEELEGIAALSGPPLLESAAKLSELRGAFETVGEFPRADARELHRRFERALDRCEAAVEGQRTRDAQRSWADLLDAADRVRAYRLAVVRNADTTLQDDLRHAAEGYIAGVVRWPKGGLEALRGGLAGQDAADSAVNEAALRKLCIRAEIATDTPTPAEDQALRREHQVQRLMQGMGQGIDPKEAQMDAMTMEWVGVGPTDEAVYLPLLERFKRCWQLVSAGDRSTE